MKNLGAIIDQLYNHYHPLFTRANITFNLDVSDPTLVPAHPAKLHSAVQLYLDFALKNHPGCEITLSNQAHQLVIKDSNYFFSIDTLNLLNQQLQKLIPGAHLRTRIGFGATLTLPLSD